MKNTLCPLSVLAMLLFAALFCAPALARPAKGPVRVLFLGHEAQNHRSDLYYPLLAKALGREAVYFDYVTTPEDAFGDADYLDHFDAVLIYANHKDIEPAHWENLKAFIENGGGFVPVHCASWCFQNIPEFDQIVGGRFASHKTGIFKPKTILPKEGAIENLPEFEAWDETYVHTNHNPENRTVLQVREVAADDNITEPEPWTWIRKQGKGRVFYTASGHDERVWNLPEFHALLKSGILWSIGDERRASYESFLKERTPLTYEKVDNIPNYEERPEPLPKQIPLSPEDSLSYTQTLAEFDLKVFASEPDIVNPIGLAWDERGRLWVAETVDYPNEVRSEGGNDSIKVLEDTDGDGKCDKVTVFADGLNIPTSLTFWDGGIIVAQAPDFLYLKDEDGDDKADIRKVLFTGWGINDTHAGPSNLRYGLDNWIHGTVGYAGFKGEVGGREKTFRMGHFRFKPDGSEIEFLHQYNNNTWGLGFNAAGDAFGSTANNNPSFYGGVPATIYGEGTPGISAKMIADSSVFHPITPNIRQVDVFGGYTAGAGHALATSNNFPKDYRDHFAFVAGPTGNLLGRFELIPDGNSYQAKNRSNLIASADEWFSPVAAEVGPDGNLWVADWYNFIIQHNPTPKPERGGYEGVNGKGNAHENPNRDRQHGRIYRAIWEGAEDSKIKTLKGASPADLVAALNDDNLFWRSTAQRILVAGKTKEAVPALREIAKGDGVGAIHAIWTLAGIGELDRETHLSALLGKDSDLKRNAVRALETDPDSLQLFFDSAVMSSPDPKVRLAAFIKLSEFPENDAVKMAAEQLMKEKRNRDDEWLSLALQGAGAKQKAKGPATFGPNLLPNPGFEKIDADRNMPADWMSRTYQGEANQVVDRKEARSGKRSLRINAPVGADSSAFAKVTLEPNTDYRLSGWVKTKGLSGARGAQLNVHEIQGENSARTNGIRKNNDWTLLEVDFNSGNRTQVTINCLFGGWGQSKGTAWWDDVAIRKVTYETIDENATDLSKGDVERGLKIFNEHQIAACIRCHKLDGRGEGIIGPDLGGIASRKDRDYLYKSLIDPMAEMAEGFPAEVSPMPPMGVLLKPQELADVMAYLMTLR